MCVMLLLNIVYIRVFYYNIGQEGQFGAVDKFERSDTAQTEQSWVQSPTETLLFLPSTSLHDVMHVFTTCTSTP